MHPEVLQHVEDGLEPEVLHAALPVLVQGQAEVLQEAGEPQVRTELLQNRRPSWRGDVPAGLLFS